MFLGLKREGELRLVGMCDQGRWLFVQEGLEGFGFE
jgi:hypothetical protein